MGKAMVTSQKKVHGREKKQGWILVLVNEIVLSFTPWQEYPTHSGEVLFLGLQIAYAREKSSILYPGGRGLQGPFTPRRVSVLEHWYPMTDNGSEDKGYVIAVALWDIFFLLGFKVILLY